MMKRIISFAMVLVLMVTMLPVNVLAETIGTENQFYAEGSTIWLPEGEEPTQDSYPVDTQRGDQWVFTEQTENRLICETESHGHTYKCAEECEHIHVHGDDCYGKTFTCGIDEHAHTDACYTTTWSCGLTENPGHIHSTDCYQAVKVCEKEESAGHQHTEGCYTQTVTRTCGLNEGDGAYAHGEGCYDAEGNLVCELQETAGHVHSDTCDTVSSALTCGLNEGDGAYSHSEGCFVTDEIPDCGLEEGQGSHAHTEECTATTTLTCEITVHTHSTETCTWEKNETLVCGKDDTHVCVTEGCEADCEDPHHTDACYATMAMWGVANYGIMLPATENVTIQLSSDSGVSLSGKTVTITDPNGNAIVVNDENGYKAPLTTDSTGEAKTFLPDGSYIATVTDFTDDDKNTYTGSVAFTVENGVSKVGGSQVAAVSLALTQHAPKTVRVRLYYNNSYNYSNQTVIIKDAAGNVVAEVTTDTNYGSNRNPAYYGDVTLPIGTYTATVTAFNSGSYSYSGTTSFTITDSTSANSYVTITLVRLGNYSNAERRYDNKAANNGTFDHVDVRVNGDFSINGVTYPITLANPKVEVIHNGQVSYSRSFTNSTSYEWRMTGIDVYTTDTVRVTFDILYEGETVVRGYTVTYAGKDDFVFAIQNCDAQQGLDFRISEAEIMEAVSHSVSYNWTGLPEGLTSLPAGSTGLLPNTSYTVNTSYYQGYRIPGPDGYYYVFSGWEYYIDGDGRTELNPQAPGSITIDSDTVIWGVWKKTDVEVPTEKGHIDLKKVFVGMTEMPDNFYIDVTHEGYTDGINAETVGQTVVNADGDLEWTYSLAIASNGEYTFTENNYEEPGYAVTAASAAVPTEGTTYMTAATGTNTVTVTVTLPLDTDGGTGTSTGDSIDVGDVNFTNTYTQNTAEASVYPTISVHKYQTGTVNSLAGAKFVLTPIMEYVYDEEGNRNEVADASQWSNAFKAQTSQPLTTGTNGRATSGTLLPGAYSLKETEAPAGYTGSGETYYVYVLKEREETVLQNNQFVTTTYYDSHVALYGDTENHEDYNVTTNTLAVYNDEILGSMVFHKEFALANRVDLNITEGASITLHVTGPNGYSQYVELQPVQVGEEINWSAELSGLKPGTYTVTEANTSLHGYNWLGATFTVTGGQNVTTGADKKSVTVTIPNNVSKPEVSVEITNTYTVWDAAELFIFKKDGTSNEPLSGVAFTLYSDADCKIPVAHSSTTAEGEAYFGNLTVPQGKDSVVYYLKETTARAGYEPKDTVWIVTVFVKDNGDGSKEYDLSVSGDFNHGTDTLTVTNERILGSLAISKDYGAGNEMPDDLKQIHVLVTGPDNYAANVTLDKTLTGWETETLTNLAWGEYTIQEIHAEVPGYTLKTLYNGVEVSEATVTVDAAHTAQQSVLITNTYDKQTAVVHNPTSFSVLKHDSETHKPLQGAVFQLFADANCTTPLTGVSFNTSATTNENGFAKFDNIQLPETDKDLKLVCYMKEVTAPDGYELPGDIWTVTITEDGLEAVESLNTSKNIFETVYDWIVSITGGQNDPHYDSDNHLDGHGVISVHNTRKKTTLTVKKVVEYFVEGEKTNDVNTINHLIANVTAGGVDLVPNAYEITTNIAGTSGKISLADGGEQEYEVSYNDTYSFVETVTGSEAFTLVGITNTDSAPSSITNGTSGKVDLDELDGEIEVVFTNRYHFNQWDDHEEKTDEQEMTACLKFKKVDDSGNILIGAGFTLYKQDASGDLAPVATTVSDAQGIVHFDVHEEGTYVLKETLTPAGYKTAADITIEVTKEYEISTVTENNVTTKYILKKLIAKGLDKNEPKEIVNEKNPGTITITKDFEGLDTGVSDNVKVVMHVHGPIEYENGKPTAESFAKVQRKEMTAANFASGITFADLERGATYLVHEAYAAVHGYNWKGVSYIGGTPKTIDDVVYQEIVIGDTVEFAIALTNSYQKWEAVDFDVHKTDSESGKPMSKVIFTLYADEACTDKIADATTNGSGYANFSDLKMTISEETGLPVDHDGVKTDGTYYKYFYLKETTPANYVINDTIYQVEVTLANISDTDVPAWDYDVIITGGGTFDHDHDELAVTNEPVLGSIVITKDVTGDLTEMQEENDGGVASVTFHVTGPDGYSQYHTMNWDDTNAWTLTIPNLRMGEYKIAELDANRLGYTWTASYTLDGAADTTALPIPTNFVDVELETTDVDHSIQFVNNYTKNRADDIITPAALTILKTDDHGKPLAGAEFTLYNADGSVYDYDITDNQKDGVVTTGSNGLATIANIYGDQASLAADPEAETTFKLKETKAPDGYKASDAEWIVTVSADGTTLKLDALNQHTGLFETIINWVLGENSSYTYDNGRLVVENEPEETKLTVKKIVQYTLDGKAIDKDQLEEQFPDVDKLLANDYAFITSLDSNAPTDYRLKDGDTKEFTIDFNSTYEVDEVVPADAVYEKTLPENAKGTIGLKDGKPEPVLVEVVNTYNFWSYNEHEEKIDDDLKTCLVFQKVDEETGAALAGATFSLYKKGSSTPLDTQTTAGDGILHFHVTEAGDYYLKETAAPDGYGILKNTINIKVEIQYRTAQKDGKPVIVDELVPKYNGKLMDKDDPVEITNKLLPISVTVEKVWDDDNFYARPDSVWFQLLKNGVKNGLPVKLEADKNGKWTHTWENLDPYAEWTVEEVGLNDKLGYTTDYSDLENGKITVTNTRVTKTIQLTLKKVWYNYSTAIPTSISVDVYRNGVKVDTVKITAANKWTATYDITDNAKWEFEEVKVPGFYTRSPKFDADTNTITITNYAIIIPGDANPKTGDSIMTAVNVMALSASALAILLVVTKKNRKRAR